jgi:hypothetical protein
MRANFKPDNQKSIFENNPSPTCGKGLLIEALEAK